MPKQSKKQKESNYVTTIRHPEHKAIAAGVFRGRTPDGFTYLYFELSRPETHRQHFVEERQKLAAPRATSEETAAGPVEKTR